MHVVSAAPEVIRVSVVGGRTQLDVALPADIPVAAFLPELARLIKSRDAERAEDLTDRDERRTFWVLSRAGGADALDPDRSLRAAALSPPALYDDVVDAAARLNRASYAAWGATTAATMAFAGLWLCSAVWVVLLLAPALSPHRSVIMGSAAVTIVTLVAAAALVRRVLGRADIAAAVGPPVIAIGSAAGWVLAAPYGFVGLTCGCAVLLGLTAICHRLIRAGHWTYVAAAVLLGFGAVVFGGRALGAAAEVVATVAAVVAVFFCLLVPALTARLDRYPVAPADPSRTDDPFTTTVEPAPSGTQMPSAEQVWARVRSAVLTRSGLLAGAAVVTLVAASALMRVETGWPAFAFAVTCASVLALHARRAATWPERAALAVPALGLVLTSCLQAQAGAWPLQLTGVGLLAVIAIGGVASTWVAASVIHRWRPVAGYLEYVAVAAVIPLALWPLGLYERLGG